MTQLQKLAWVNLVFLPLLIGIAILGQRGILSDKTLLTLTWVLLAGVIAVMILMAKMPWHKGTIEDERDKEFRKRSFAAAYFVLLICLPIGLVASVIAFPTEQVPLKSIAGWIGLSGVASVMAQSVAILIQYKKGVIGTI